MGSVRFDSSMVDNQMTHIIISFNLDPEPTSPFGNVANTRSHHYSTSMQLMIEHVWSSTRWSCETLVTDALSGHHGERWRFSWWQ